MNLPRRVRDLQLPLHDIASWGISPSFTENAFFVKMKDDRAYVFFVYEGLRLGLLPLYSALRDRWLKALSAAVGEGSSKILEPCGGVAVNGVDEMNPHLKGFLLWLPLCLLVVGALAFAGFGLSIILMAVGVQLLSLILLLGRIHSG
jgi:hypothetical protein